MNPTAPTAALLSVERTPAQVKWPGLASLLPFRNEPRWHRWGSATSAGSLSLHRMRGADACRAVRLGFHQVASGIALCLGVTLGGWAAEPVAKPVPLAPSAGASEFEQLAQIKVASVSRSESTVQQSPAAVFVITQEDIRRSGATSIPEALRMAPGMDVARQNGHTWAISVRGFNSVTANKLLVLVDGRSVYSPISSGVSWEAQDTLMEDIDRIEVIRGAAGTLWGANAVNGVINIITKSARDTQGWLVTGGGGTEELGFGSVRYGTKLGEDTFLRLFGKYYNRDDQSGQFARTSGGALVSANSADASWQARGGFRLDWEPAQQNELTLQGELFNGEADNLTLPGRSAARLKTGNDRKAGGFVLGRWTHHFSAESEWKLQTYFDRSEDETLGVGASQASTFDVDFQHRFPLGERQEVTWGAAYRWVQDANQNYGVLTFAPAQRNSQLLSGFVQDTVTLVPDRLKLTLGSKFEHNDFSGGEVQPSTRLLWTPHAQHTVWAAVSRAVRTPFRSDQDIRFNVATTGAGAVLVNDIGNPRFKSEELLAYELGYRVQPHPRFTLDLALFYNDYDRLRTFETIPTVAPALVSTLTPDNKAKGQTYGGEVTGTWQATDHWRLQANYSMLQMNVYRRPGSTDTSAAPAEGQSPQQQVGVRSLWDVTRQWQLDGGVRYVDALPALKVPSYYSADVRLGWRPSRDWELSVVAQSLFDNHRPEFLNSNPFISVTEVQHSVYGKVTWRF